MLHFDFSIHIESQTTMLPFLAASTCSCDATYWTNVHVLSSLPTTQKVLCNARFLIRVQIFNCVQHLEMLFSMPAGFYPILCMRWAEPSDTSGCCTHNFLICTRKSWARISCLIGHELLMAKCTIYYLFHTTLVTLN